MCVCVQRLNATESERLQVQIQAYLDNMFDIGAMLEDAEAKNTLMEHLEELQEENTQVHIQNTLHKCSSLQTNITSTMSITTLFLLLIVPRTF